MFGVLINVASSSQNPNGRGQVFADDSFEYLPIPEDQETTERIPTYRDLGFINVKFPDLRVHVDPEFETFTYGHVKRGFGDVQRIAQLKKEDALFFYATLQRDSGWSPYIIGFFVNLEVYDCRKLSTEEIRNLSSCGFKNNAHLKRKDPHVDFLIRGGGGSKLLNKAFSLAQLTNSFRIRDDLENVISTAGNKKIETGKPWYRWTLVSHSAERIINLINLENEKVTSH